MINKLKDSYHKKLLFKYTHFLRFPSFGIFLAKYISRDALKKAGGILFFISIILVGTHKLIIAAEIRSMFQKEGFDNIELYVDSVGLHEATFKFIVIGDTEPLQIEEAHFDYTLLGLLRHRVDNITLQNVTINAHLMPNPQHSIGEAPTKIYPSPLAEHPPLDDDTQIFEYLGYTITSQVLGNFIRDFIPHNSSALLPDYLFDPESFFFDSLTINKSTMHVKGDGIDVNIPFQLVLHKDKEISFRIDTGTISGKAMEYSLSGENNSAHFTLDKTGHWVGQWKSTLVPKHENQEGLPTFNAQGDFTIAPVFIDAKVLLKTVPDFIYTATQFHLENHQSTLTLQEARIPWAGGSVGVRNLTVPADFNHLINLNLECNKVQLADLLHVLISPAITATGHISGTLPMGIARSGNVLLYRGTFHTEESGIISIPDDVIPKDAKDRKTLSKTLQKFHYTRIDITVESDEGDNFSVNLSLDGNNYHGSKGKPHEVNLRINSNILNSIDKIKSLANIAK